jgi:hypothetical protein
VILASLVQIPLWDVGAGPSDESVSTEASVAVGVHRHEKESSLVKVMSAKHGSKFVALSPVMMTAAG